MAAGPEYESSANREGANVKKGFIAVLERARVNSMGKRSLPFDLVQVPGVSRITGNLGTGTNCRWNLTSSNRIWALSRNL